MKKEPDSYCKDHHETTTPFSQLRYLFLVANLAISRLLVCHSCNSTLTFSPLCQDLPCLWKYNFLFKSILVKGIFNFFFTNWSKVAIELFICISIKKNSSFKYFLATWSLIWNYFSIIVLLQYFCINFLKMLWSIKSCINSFLLSYYVIIKGSI